MKIKWVARSKDVELLVPCPKSAKSYLPEWYKNIQPAPSKYLMYEKGESIQKSLKSCMPFLDALGTGYIQETWSDVVIKISKNENEEYFYEFNQRSGPQLLKVREEHQYPIKNYYVPFEFAWQVPWLPVVPKGYSALFLPILNRPDLIINSVAGVIDSDDFFHNHGNLPFHIEYNDSEILIPCGTPMYQIVPIRRDNWKSEIEQFDEDKSKKLLHSYLSTYSSQYIKKYWKKKKYD